jgi:sulfatase maturation enzyme AslB (radical SAM superfamily)
VIQSLVSRPDYARTEAAAECERCEFQELCQTNGNPAPPIVALDSSEELYCRRTLQAALALHEAAEQSA